MGSRRAREGDALPDKQGNLSEAEQAKAKAWIARFWNNFQGCPICGRKEWQLAGNLVNLHIAYPDAALTVGGPVYPQALLICETCGYTMLFNAVMMGLAKPGDASNG